jgi:hypothetical protein
MPDSALVSQIIFVCHLNLFRKHVFHAFSSVYTFQEQFDGVRACLATPPAQTLCCFYADTHHVIVQNSPMYYQVEHRRNAF